MYVLPRIFAGGFVVILREVRLSLGDYAISSRLARCVLLSRDQGLVGANLSACEWSTHRVELLL